MKAVIVAVLAFGMLDLALPVSKYLYREWKSKYLKICKFDFAQIFHSYLLY